MPVTLSTHSLSYIAYNKPNIPNIYGHTHHLIQENEKFTCDCSSHHPQKLVRDQKLHFPMIQARPLWLAHFHLKIFITSFSLHASYIPIMPNSSLYLEHILVSFHFWGLCEEYVLCPEPPSALHIKINVLKDSSSISFTVESYLPLFHCPTLIHCSSVLL